MANVNITINGKALSVPVGATVLEAARENGIHIPTLCFLKELSPHASCRMCVVEVEGARTFQHACAAKVREGMVVHTDTEAVRASRKLTLELLLSNHPVDCHHCLRIGSSKCDDLDPKLCESCFFCDCERDGFCELQALAREYKVDVLPFTQKHNTHPVDASTVIVRNPNKCIKCKRCLDVCGKVQTVHNLSVAGRGCEVSIGPAFGKTMAESECVGCGRCAEVCPTAAIFVKEHKDEAVYFAHQYGTETVCMLSGSVLPELEQLYKLPQGSLVIGQAAAALKKIGIDHIFTDAQAKAVAANRAADALDARLGSDRGLILTTSAAAKKFLAREYPELSDHFLFCDDEQKVFAEAAKAKHPDARRYQVSADNGFAVEAAESGNVDFFINARELYRIFLRTGGAPHRRKPLPLENLNDTPPCARYKALLKTDGFRLSGQAEECLFTENGREWRALICHNLGQFRAAAKALDYYDVIRVIA